MGWIEAILLGFAIFWGLNELGSEIRKGLVEAAKVANRSGKDNTDDA